MPLTLAERRGRGVGRLGSAPGLLPIADRCTAERRRLQVAWETCRDWTTVDDSSHPAEWESSDEGIRLHHASILNLNETGAELSVCLPKSPRVFRLLCSMLSVPCICLWLYRSLRLAIESYTETFAIYVRKAETIDQRVETSARKQDFDSSITVNQNPTLP